MVSRGFLQLVPVMQSSWDDGTAFKGFKGFSKGDSNDSTQLPCCFRRVRQCDVDVRETREDPDEGLRLRDSCHDGHRPSAEQGCLTARSAGNESRGDFRQVSWSFSTFFFPCSIPGIQCFLLFLICSACDSSLLLTLWRHLSSAAALWVSLFGE